MEKEKETNTTNMWGRIGVLFSHYFLFIFEDWILVGLERNFIDSTIFTPLSPPNQTHPLSIFSPPFRVCLDRLKIGKMEKIEKKIEEKISSILNWLSWKHRGKKMVGPSILHPIPQKCISSNWRENHIENEGRNPNDSFALVPCCLSLAKVMFFFWMPEFPSLIQLQIEKL